MKNAVLVFSMIMPSLCFAMADRTPPVYGRPTLYGEYEISPDDAMRAAKYYGDGPRPAPILRGADTNKAVAKHPVKTKAVVAKKAVKKKAKKKTLVAKSAKKPKVPVKDEKRVNEKHVDIPKLEMPAKAEQVVVVPKRAEPSGEAKTIAGAVKNKRDVSSYCVTRGVQSKGVLPDGIVLMLGRPDLMSCVDK